MKRAACDRCHKLKMRCSGPVCKRSGICHRCRAAGVHCNYSAPRKPGRPPLANRSIGSNKDAVVPASSRGTAQSFNGVEDIQDSCAEKILESQNKEISEAEVLAIMRTDDTNPSLNWSDLTCLEENTMIYSLQQSEQVNHAFPNWAPGTEQDSEAWSHASERQWQPKTPSILVNERQLEQEPTGFGNDQRRGSTSDNVLSSFSQQQVTPVTIDTPELVAELDQSTAENTPSVYRQQFSEFHLRLALHISLEDDISWKRLEQSAADVFESCELFLELASFKLLQGIKRRSAQSHGLNMPESQHRHQSFLARFSEDNVHSGRGSDDSDNPKSTFVPDTAAVLHLFAFAMRLSEMHHNLFAAVYRYMQQQNPSNLESREGGINNTTRHVDFALSSPLSVRFSIAGVVFAPKPCFQLQLLLQACAHYLSNIRKAISGVQVFESHRDASASTQSLSQGSLSEAAVVRTLAMQHQQKQMEKVREILAKIRQEFDIDVHL